MYFGDGAYGAEVAAQSYFGKSARTLTLSEAATLAGLLHAPSSYTTWEGEVALEPVTERSDRVLRLMKDQGMISTAQYREARSSPLDFAPDPPPRIPRMLPSWRGSAGRSRRRWERMPSRSGDSGSTPPSTQSSSTLPWRPPGTYSTPPDDPAAAIVTVEPQSGAIKALAGREGSFNLALDARRQPGSSFKPIVLAAALKENISPESIYVSRELSFDFQEKGYVIDNYDSVERGRSPSPRPWSSRTTRSSCSSQPTWA